MTEIAKVFTNGGSQAVRLPKDFRFSDTEILVNKVGDAVILTPKDSKWQAMLESLDMFTDDFMKEGRGDLKAENRETL